MGTVAKAIASWSPAAQTALAECDKLFAQVADDAGIGALDTALKWGQPSWRPVKPRTGSTLRFGWSENAADTLSVYVDCKTDIAARFSEIYPGIPSDDRRHLSFPLPLADRQEALRHLAAMTFTYHLQKRAG